MYPLLLYFDITWCSSSLISLPSSVITMSILIEATNNANCEQLSCLSVSGFVNSDVNLTEHPEIINGASDMIYKILGDNGKHTRIAVGCASLPRNAAVEISSIFHLN